MSVAAASHSTDLTCNECIDKVLQSGHRIINQSRDDKDLSDEEKREILREQIEQKPHLFLEKYHQCLDASCVEYFENRLHQIGEGNSAAASVVLFYISKINKQSNLSSKAKSNLRYRAMVKLMNETSFFTESQMRSRDPEAYHTMIGQFLTNEELNSVITEPIVSSQSDGKRCKYDHLLDTLDERLGYSSTKTKPVENQMNELHVNDEEEFDSSSDDENDCDVSNKNDVIDDRAESANVLRRREFLFYMQNKFLSGMEREVDYGNIDEDYCDDWCMEEERDTEDAWFEDD